MFQTFAAVLMLILFLVPGAIYGVRSKTVSFTSITGLHGKNLLWDCWREALVFILSCFRLFTGRGNIRSTIAIR